MLADQSLCRGCVIVQDAIDWRRLRVMWSPSRNAQPARGRPPCSPQPTASSFDSQGDQSRSAMAAADQAAMAEANEMTEADASGPAPSQHSAPTVPGQPAANSPPLGRVNTREPPGSAGGATGQIEEHKENEVNNFSRYASRGPQGQAVLIYKSIYIPHVHAAYCYHQPNQG